MIRVAITTLGCKINQFESAAMHELLGATGYELVPFDQNAEVYVVNTCTVTARSDSESRKLIRRARRRNPAARIVVTGCYAQVDPESIAAMPEVDLVIGNTEKKGLAEILAAVDADRVQVADIADEEQAAPLHLETHAEHTRAFLQIQTGCDAFCSYCIVPYARGRSRSVSFDEALEGVRTFSRKGFNEVVLTGIHLGAFGLDLTPRRNLLELLQAIEAEPTLPRLRLGSLEPGEITDGLIEFMAGSRIVCHHLHIPLQSGSDSVLARMNRTYSVAFFRERVLRLHASVPDIFIGMDVIAGFPGETDAEFAATVELVESLPCAALHVFPFSLRPGTPAAELTDRVGSHVAKERVQTLLRLSERKREEFFRRFVGHDMETLILHSRRDGCLEGLTRNYIPVSVAGAGAVSVGSEITIRIERAGTDRCYGAYSRVQEVSHAVL